MALPQNTHVYMETVETSKNKEKKSDKDGSTQNYYADMTARRDTGIVRICNS